MTALIALAALIEAVLVWHLASRLSYRRGYQAGIAAAGELLAPGGDRQ